MVRPSVLRETRKVMAAISVRQLESARDESAAAILSALNRSLSGLAVTPIDVRIEKLVLPKAHMDSLRRYEETRRENERLKQELKERQEQMEAESRRRREMREHDAAPR